MFKTSVAALMLILAFASCENPHITPEETSSDPQIRARELNDSAIDLVNYSFEKYAGKALVIFDASILMDSVYDKARLNKIAVLLQQQKFDQALAEFKPLENLRPWDPDLLVCKGLLQEITGDNANAVFSYQSAIKKYQEWPQLNDSLLPDDDDLKVREASVWFLLKDQEKAEELFLSVQDSTMVVNARASLPDRRKMLGAFWKVMVPRS